jgi:hypothetical protein
MHQAESKLQAAEPAKVYRASGAWRFFIILCSVLMIGGSMAGIGYVLFHARAEAVSSTVTLGVVCVSFALLGLGALLSILRSKVVLFSDRIRVEGLIVVKEFTRAQLRGWRVQPTWPATLVLQPKDRAVRPAKTALTFPIDDQLGAWLDALPSLDHEEAETSLEEIQNDSRLGATPSRRTAVYRQAKRRASLLSGIAMVASLWAILYPRPYMTLVLALVALPWIAVVMLRASHGLLRSDELRNDAHPNVAVALMFPGLALLLRAVMDFNIIQSALVVLLCLTLGGALAFAVIWSDAWLRTRKGAVAIFCGLSLAYGYGTAIEANSLLDRSPDAHYSAVVRDKEVIHGKHTSYQLELGPWGPKSGTNTLDVSSETYGAIQKGDVVRLSLRHGALGVEWYYMQAWQRASEPLE